MKLKSDLLEAFSLNKEQLQAIHHINGNALILAGAGTGKTHTLVCKVIKAIEAGNDPEEMMLLTFTNKAAFEMTKRVELYLGKPLFGLMSGTFHSVACRLLKKYHDVLEKDINFSILDAEDAKKIFEHIKISLNMKSNNNFPKKNVLYHMLSYMRSKDIELSELLFNKYPDWLEHEDEIHAIFTKYFEIKKNTNAYDFDDLLDMFLTLLNHSKTQELIKEQYKLIFVDEFQDTNKVQDSIIYQLSLNAKGLTVVGDDAQSIYSFRGARFQNIIDFQNKYSEVNITKLETNYRSTKQILNFANHIISHNMFQYKKNLVPYKNKEGDLPFIYKVFSEEQQSELIAQMIDQKREQGVSLNEMAVFYRAHSLSLSLQMVLTKNGIPFKIFSGLRFFEQAHVKDLLCFMKVIHNPMDASQWKRLLLMLPSVGIKSVTKIITAITQEDSVQKVTDLLSLIGSKIPKKAQKSFSEISDFFNNCINNSEFLPSDTIGYLLEMTFLNNYIISSYENHEFRLEELSTLGEFSSKYCSLDIFLTEISLVAEKQQQASVSDNQEMITLTTIHQAKGLEWEITFIISMNEGMFPSYKSFEIEEIEEERRLFYVAATRAKSELFIIFLAVNHRVGSSHKYLKPSRFLEEIDEDLYEFENYLDY